MERSLSVNPYVQLAWRAVPVIGLCWLLIAFISLDHPAVLLQALTLGSFAGTMYGQTTLAAAWAVLGPGPFTVRLAGSLAWVFMLPMAASLNAVLDRGPPLAAVIMLGAYFFGQWLLLQFMLWPLSIGFGLHVQHLSEQGDSSGRSHRQFGIRQLIIVTAIVAVFLGIGRFAFSFANQQSVLVSADSIAFLLMAVAAGLMTVPLVLAALLKRHAGRAVIVMLVVTGLMAVIESPLFRLVQAGIRPSTLHFLARNFVSAAVVLAVMATVRSSGFRLHRIGSQPPQ
jgi:hypothetical protein